ncbi:terminase TerL endonuclease subunit [Micromonospora aurantiaca]|uniref:terminase large subunit n=1 Tax=Micromonospora aurantiaca (nom. illeg.) TaxID=47850 RepID=UPI0034482705
MTTRGRTSSTSRHVAAIEAAIDDWVQQGLVESTPWYRDGYRPLIETPLPSGKGVYFEPAAVERVLKFFLLLRHLIGRHVAQKFILLDWQVRYLIAPVFGLLRFNEEIGRAVRVIRTVWFEIPRKNGKSTLCSGLALYLFAADREAGAEVYAAAGDRAQAGIVFNAAANMARGCAALRKRLGKRGIQRKLLEHPHTNSIMRALSSEGLRQHGLNVHGGLVDEVHVHKNPDVIDALETGTGSRAQPLIVFITTADDGDDTSVYATKREEVERLAGRHARDETIYGVVFAADTQAEGYDPYAEETLRQANPGFGVTVLADYLRGKAEQARRSPRQQNRYLRLHLNVRTKQTTRWFQLERWDRGAATVPLAWWKGRRAVGGLDLSSTSDLTAFVFVARTEDGGYALRPMFWLPEERADEMERDHGLPFAEWVKAGLIRLTEGNIVDYSAVRDDIVAEARKLGVTMTEIAYDPWNATETVQHLEKAGYTLVPVRQGWASLSAACKALERAVLGSTDDKPLVRHGGHAILRWNADCVEVRDDGNGNIRPVKPHRGTSTKRIDGIAATVTAITRLVAPEQPQPEPGIRIIGRRAA